MTDCCSHLNRLIRKQLTEVKLVPLNYSKKAVSNLYCKKLIRPQYIFDNETTN